ncbi:MAG: hypothetical protein RMJ97_00570 [Raineya sp.]|nr:hypothetical protein [Raineya sp.]
MQKFTLQLLLIVLGLRVFAEPVKDSTQKSYVLPYLLAQPQKILKPEVRPFITDDARVVGDHLFQIETWGRADEANFQWWALAAYGPKHWLELTAGWVKGMDFEPERGFAYALPLLQAKFLIREYKPNQLPGLGWVIGTFLPYGQGSFKPPGYGTFSYLTITQSLGEGDKVLIHGNLGFNYLHIAGEHQWLNTWGIGTQIKTLGGFHLVGELFSGDPYVPGSGTSFQVGFRHFFSDDLQIDGTIGKGIAGEEILPLWVSAGVRMVFHWFEKK